MIKTFLFNNLSTIVVAILLAVVLFLAVKKIIKDKKSGKCCQNCEGCAFSENCNKKAK